MWYAHSLLFACPDCSFPIALSLVSEKKNFEEVDEDVVIIKCSLCGQASEVVAITAKTHWVADWDFDSMISKLKNQHQPDAQSNRNGISSVATQDGLASAEPDHKRLTK